MRLVNVIELISKNNKAKSKMLGFSSVACFISSVHGVRCSPLLRFYSSASVKGYTKRNSFLTHCDEQTGTLCKANLNEDQILLTLNSRLQKQRKWCVWDSVPRSRPAKSQTSTKAMFGREKTCNFIVFSVILILFSGKICFFMLNVKSCLTLKQ